MLDWLRQVAEGIALVLGIALGLLFILYAFQMIVRTVRHLNLKDPPPPLTKGKMLGFEWETEAAATVETGKLVKNLEQQMNQMDQKFVRLWVRVLEIEGKEEKAK